MSRPNTRLRQLREHTARLTRQGLAERANAYLWNQYSARVELDANYIGKLERGVISWPGGRYREAFRAVLGVATDAELGFRNTRRTPPVHPRPDLPGPARVDERHVREVLGAADLLHRWHHLHGGWSMRAATLAQLRWAAWLRRTEVPEALRRQLDSAIAHLAHTCGFMAFDTGDHPGTRRYLRFALSCAESAADWQSRAFILASLARHATWVGQSEEALTFTQHALVRADRLTATERSMLHTARAKALAATGRTREAVRELGIADDQFSRADPRDDPPWMSFYDRAQHSGDTAEAFAYLRAGGDRTVETRTRFTAAYAGHGAPYARSRALAHARLATVVLAGGDLAEGAAIGGAALETAGTIRSALITDTLRALDRCAARHVDVREVRDLRERLRPRLS
ncbi:XRE family transcriptional regulator [Amycolatopsis aidingensis]|uniref:XRE family transcriptional regulator n=1 Tax=Amycolatopsis aidingensis TaxID=2842453 RepID=UPI001C0DD0C6|nr:XRE family transcriptional regulator [Amycolatopsis aidingensis]